MSLSIALPSEPDPEPGSGILRIGFLNNLSDAALDQGERQIEARLTAASGPARVSLRLFSLSSIPRQPSIRAYMDGRYGDESDLMRTRLDGLFVSGAEPQAATLEDEIFWPQLAAVVDWARTGPRSSIWSCLAAHAAVLRLDGIRRRRLTEKRAGFFAVEPVVKHPLLDGLARTAPVAQSRWNGLDERDLIAAGYEILTDAGSDADTFVKDVGSLFIFLQGHPEYDIQALGREYRRDVLRFLSGRREIYPTLPRSYFAHEDEATLRAYAASASRNRRSPPPFDLPPPRADLAEAGHLFADTIFGNWLRLLQVSALEHAA